MLGCLGIRLIFWFGVLRKLLNFRREPVTATRLVWECGRVSPSWLEWIHSLNSGKGTKMSELQEFAVKLYGKGIDFRIVSGVSATSFDEACRNVCGIFGWRWVGRAPGLEHAEVEYVAVDFGYWKDWCSDKEDAEKKLDEYLDLWNKGELGEFRGLIGMCLHEVPPTNDFSALVGLKASGLTIRWELLDSFE